MSHDTIICPGCKTEYMHDMDGCPFIECEECGLMFCADCGGETRKNPTPMPYGYGAIGAECANCDNICDCYKCLKEETE